jgi:hypothetical protein
VRLSRCSQSSENKTDRESVAANSHGDLRCQSLLGTDYFDNLDGPKAYAVRSGRYASWTIRYARQFCHHCERSVNLIILITSLTSHDRSQRDFYCPSSGASNTKTGRVSIDSVWEGNVRYQSANAASCSRTENRTRSVRQPLAGVEEGAVIRSLLA